MEFTTWDDFYRQIAIMREMDSENTYLINSSFNARRQAKLLDFFLLCDLYHAIPNIAKTIIQKPLEKTDEHIDCESNYCNWCGDNSATITYILEKHIVKTRKIVIIKICIDGEIDEILLFHDKRQLQGHGCVLFSTDPEYPSLNWRLINSL